MENVCKRDPSHLTVASQSCAFLGLCAAMTIKKVKDITT